MVNYSQSRDYYYKYKALKYYLKNNNIEKQKQIKGGIVNRQNFSFNDFSVVINEKLAVEEGKSVSKLMFATAYLPCIVKEGPIDDDDMKQERQVLEDCNKQCYPILTGEGNPYYLGSDTNNDSLRLIFREGHKSLASHFGYGENTIVNCYRQNLAFALQICLGVLKALKPLHKSGWVHMDIHPGNVLYNKQTEKVTLIDYGAAVKINSDGDQVRERSWEYSAPEQWDKERCTEQTDSFAVVGLLVYLVTGKAPFVVLPDDGITINWEKDFDKIKEDHKTLCKNIVMGLESDVYNQQAENFLNRTEEYVGYELQHNAGLDDGSQGLRHLLYMGMRYNPQRWTCEKLEEEMKKLFNATINNKEYENLFNKTNKITLKI